ncbi:hypothetical protein L484_023409 [Morus notabilis]|uniref:PGG domain-containing protein n=2 Tax=Morus notabilis TaxID=981085 RepID=W9SG53_9ROSA|nr:hypothetical protein L484_023409 [Morus notabilis]
MLHRAGDSKCSSFFWWKSSTSLTNYVTSNLSTIEGVSNASPAPTSCKLSAVNHESDSATLEGQPQHNNVKSNDLLPHKFSKVRHPLEGWVIDITRGRNNLSEDSRNMMLVALVLIATVGYQGVLSPPGGLSQEDNNSTTTHKSVSLFHPPGIAVMGNWNFLVFMLSNSLALALTANAIIFLVLPDRLESRWWVYTRNLLAISTALCYLISLLTISPNALLFALAIAIPAIAFLLIPSAYGVITRNLELRTEDLMSPDNITYGLTDIV